jgi:hypothetical protein
MALKLQKKARWYWKGLLVYPYGVILFGLKTCKE